MTQPEQRSHISPGSRRLMVAAATAAILAAGCGASGAPEASGIDDLAPTARAAATTAPATMTAATTTAAAARKTASARAALKPRRRELRIAMGEWAVVPESGAVRPGRITLVITNRGKLPHGFEIKAESGGGRRGGERLELSTRVLRPGQTQRLRVTLPEGVYEIECYVADHDDRGMQRLLDVGSDAPPLRRAAPRTRATGTSVDIAGFAYQPRSLTVSAGQSVTWRNSDSAPHTVTQAAGRFASDTLARGATYRRTFDTPGRYSYLCALHPDMKGAVTVKP